MAVAAVASPLKVMGGLFPFFYGRQVQGSVTYFGKVAAGNGFFGKYIADQSIKLWLGLFYTTETIELYAYATDFEMLTCGMKIHAFQF